MHCVNNVKNATAWVSDARAPNISIQHGDTAISPRDPLNSVYQNSSLQIDIRKSE